MPALETEDCSEEAQRVEKLTAAEARGWCADDTAVWLAVVCLAGSAAAHAVVWSFGGGAAAVEGQSHAECLPRASWGWWGVERRQCMLCLWVWMRGGTKEQAKDVWPTRLVYSRVYRAKAAASNVQHMRGCTVRLPGSGIHLV